MRRNTTHSILWVTRSLKCIGRSVGRRHHKSIARQVMKDKRIRGHVLSFLLKDVQKELAAMCSLKKNSILRSGKPGAFSWAALKEELQQTAPTLFTIINGSLQVYVCPSELRRHKTREVRRANKTAITGLCAALPCRYYKNNRQLLVN